ncbi:MAG: ZIP family zinc transporter [Thermoleophilaceae bacterium]|nr:ZIP family zinc transporter [Thermoleophilaceae bacterium]
MLEAAAWGAVGGVALLLGAGAGLLFRLPLKVVSLITAFGAGVLISAVSFELTAEAYEGGGAGAVAIGLGLGAVVYSLANAAVHRRGGRNRKSPEWKGEEEDESASGLVVGSVLDGIPESVVIGLSLLEQGKVSGAVVASVFLSNVPEALAATPGLRKEVGAPKVLVLWSAIMLVSAASAALGYGLLSPDSEGTIALVQSFAAGAVICMLADEMFAKAAKHGGQWTGLVTVLGFAVAFLLTTLE